MCEANVEVAPFVEFLANVCPPLLLCPKEEISRGLTPKSVADQLRHFVSEAQSSYLLIGRTLKTKTYNEAKRDIAEKNEEYAVELGQEISRETPAVSDERHEKAEQEDEDNFVVQIEGETKEEGHEKSRSEKLGREVRKQQRRDSEKKIVEANGEHMEEPDAKAVEGAWNSEVNGDQLIAGTEPAATPEYEILISMDISSYKGNQGNTIVLLKKNGFHNVYLNSSAKPPDQFVNFLQLITLGFEENEWVHFDLLQSYFKNAIGRSTSPLTQANKDAYVDATDITKESAEEGGPPDPKVAQPTIAERAKSLMQMQTSTSQASPCVSVSSTCLLENAWRTWSDNCPRSGPSVSPLRSVGITPWVPAGAPRTSSSSPAQAYSVGSSPSMRHRGSPANRSTRKQNKEDSPSVEHGASVPIGYASIVEQQHACDVGCVRDKVDERNRDGSFGDISTVPRSSSSRMQSPQDSSRANQRSASNSPKSFTHPHYAYPYHLRAGRAKSEHNSPTPSRHKPLLRSGGAMSARSCSPSRKRSSWDYVWRQGGSARRGYRGYRGYTASSPSVSPPTSARSQTPRRPRSRTEEELHFLCDRLHSSRLRTDEKIRSLRLEKCNQEVDGCTFHPQTNHDMHRKRIASSSKDRCMLLYERGLHSKAQKIQRETEFKRDHIQEERKRCSFRPALNPGIPWMEANNPRGFHETVARLRKKDPPRECISKAPPQNVGPFSLSVNKSCTKRREVKAYLAVNLPRGKRTSITIRDGDDPARLAMNSKRLFGLTNYQRDVLQQQIQNVLEIT